MISLVLVDDHRLLIDGLRPLLEKQSDMRVVAVASDGLEAVESCRTHLPNIVLLDISMPSLNGIDAARQILRDAPKSKIIMLSMHADTRYVQESLRAGASGYILKESAAAELIQAIHSVLTGEIFLSRSLRGRVMHDYVERIREDKDLTHSPLSAREREVLQLIAEGSSTKDIAKILNLSVKTIESHRKQIMDKLDLHSIAELTKFAIREGLTQIE